MARLLDALRRKLTLRQAGQAALETLLVLPLLMLFIMFIMETAMLYNTKQILNYAGFCAARAAGVYGVNAEAERRRAAALALASISPRVPEAEADLISSKFNLSLTLTDHLPIPPNSGLSAEEIRERFIDACARTIISKPVLSGDNGSSLVTVTLTYYARCRILPVGRFVNTRFGDLLAQLAGLEGTQYLEELKRENQHGYLIPVRTSVKLDNWEPAP